MVSKHYKFKIISDVSSWIHLKDIIKKYSNIKLTTTELNILINKSSKCRVVERKGILYRKCIYCESFKEINKENFRRDSSRKHWFNTLCKIHARLKQKNYRIINIKEYKERHNEEQKRYYKNNLEKCKELSKKIYLRKKEENPEKLKKYDRERQKRYRENAQKEKLAAARNNLINK